MTVEKLQTQGKTMKKNLLMAMGFIFAMQSPVFAYPGELMTQSKCDRMGAKYVPPSGGSKPQCCYNGGLCKF